MTTDKRRLGDRRARPRFEIVGQLWGALETVEHLTLVDLGRGGVLVETRAPFHPDSILRLRFSFEGAVSDLDARVRHVRPKPGAPQDRYLVGFEFLGVPPVVVEQLERLVAANLNGAIVAEA